MSDALELQADIAAHERLATLLRECPLSSRWSQPSLFFDTVRVSNVAINLCGLVTGEADQTVTGSAAEVGADPLERAFFELVERTSILELLADQERVLGVVDGSGRPCATRHVAELFPRDAGVARRYSRSSGVAAGRTWEEACAAARAELIERDRLLRSWYGEIDPVRCGLPDRGYVEQLRTEYEWRAYLFPATPPSPLLTVAGVFAFPLTAGAPLTFGFGASDHRHDALGKAARECVQRLGFLWGEELPSSEPEFEPNAEYHQEYYLRPCMHERVRSWLDGAHRRTPCKVDSLGFPAASTQFVDLTPAHLAGRLFVARALASGELELVFGRGHPRVAGPLSERFLIHPLP